MEKFVKYPKYNLFYDTWWVKQFSTEILCFFIIFSKIWICIKIRNLSVKFYSSHLFYSPIPVPSQFSFNKPIIITSIDSIDTCKSKSSVNGQFATRSVPSESSVSYCINVTSVPILMNSRMFVTCPWSTYRLV